MKNITDLLGKQMLFFDGAMGTMLQVSGLKPGELPELLNLSHPDLITSIHKAYYDCGCHIATVNTFGANACKLRETGYSPEQVISAAVSCAKAARSLSDNPDEKFVAMDMGPIGRLIEPMGDLSFDEAYALFAEMAVCGERAGADLILIETMGATYEVKAAVLAAKENTSLPVFVTCAFDASGKTFTGADCRCRSSSIPTPDFRSRRTARPTLTLTPRPLPPPCGRPPRWGLASWAAAAAPLPCIYAK